MDELSRYVNFFADSGAQIITLHPFSLSPYLMDIDEQFRENRRVIAGLSELCSQRGVGLMLENTRHPFNSPEAFKTLLQDLEDVKIHLDFGHCNLCSGRVLAEDFFAAFGKRIKHIHFSDNFGQEDDHWRGQPRGPAAWR